MRGDRDVGDEFLNALAVTTAYTIDGRFLRLFANGKEVATLRAHG